MSKYLNTTQKRLAFVLVIYALIALVFILTPLWWVAVFMAMPPIAIGVMYAIVCLLDWIYYG